MAVQPLSSPVFFEQLRELFEAARKEGHGSVFLTQKRLTYGHKDQLARDVASSSSALEGIFEDLSPANPLPVIFKASNGKRAEKKKEKVKISTVVQPDELEDFFTKYAEVAKVGMSGLKKRDRSGRKKAAKAKKRKGNEAEKQP